MTEHRRFQVVPPDWGESHLTTEAVVAYVDGELAPGPHERACRHLEHCPDCASEVMTQRRARSMLRGAAGPSMPSSLLTSLRSIPDRTELPGPPAGLAVGADGELVDLMRPLPQDRPARRSRRMRLGTGAAVSGLALGAMTFGFPASGITAGPGPTPAPGPGATAVARFATTPAPTRERSAGPSSGGPQATASPRPSGTAAPPTPGSTLNASYAPDGR